MIAGLLLGLTEVWAQAYLEPALGSFGHNIHRVAPYLVMIAVSILVVAFAFTGRRISRWEGGLLVTAYAAYVWWLWP